MIRMAEHRVQSRAQEFLKKRYSKKARNNKIFSSLEVRTKKKYGGKRADGLLAFRHWLFGAYVVSMEAKSHKTLASIKPRRSDRAVIFNSLWAGCLLCIASGAFFALFKMQDGVFQFLLPLNILIIGGLIYGIWTVDSARHKKIKVIRQLAQYPANEMWLAFSIDSVMNLEKFERQNLSKICQRHGVGLLIVGKGKQVEVWTKPKRQWKWRGDFIKYYSCEKKIRKTIA